MQALDLSLPVPPERYHTAQGCLVASFARYPALRLNGTPGEARDLLQRLCASDLRNLPVGDGTVGQPQLLLEREGTLLDLLSIGLDDNGARIAGTPTRLPAVRQRIESMIFLENLEVVDTVLEEAWLALGDGVGGDLPGLCFRFRPALGLGLGPLPAGAQACSLTSGDWARALLDAGELPLWQQDLALNPLYTTLAGLISFTKGCYPGQEVIARMESRGRIGWQLARLTLPAPPDGELTGSPEPGPARLVGILPADGAQPARVLCLVRPQWTRLACHIEGNPHAIPLD